MLNRRNFLKTAGLSAVGMAIADKVIANPYSVLPESKFLTYTIIEGIVKSGDKPVKDCVVSDGYNVTKTDSSGEYKLLSVPYNEYVFISIPSEYLIPENPTKTARFYKTIDFSKREQRIDFELEKMPDPSKKHLFMVWADTQTLDNEDMYRLHNETVPDAVQLLKNSSYLDVFGVAAGDIMFDKLELFPDYERAVNKVGVPFFQVVGNHDVVDSALTDEDSNKVFKTHFGPAYYSFNRGDIHYVVLDDIFWFGNYVGYLEKQQLNWLKKDLSFVEKGKKVVLFTHIPALTSIYKRYGEESPDNSVIITNRALLYEILDGYDSYIISGHTHESEFLVEDGVKIHVVGAVCGAWWSGDISRDGTPNGYAVYEADGSNLKWYYKSTKKESNHQMRVYNAGSDKKNPDQIIANIWFAEKDDEVNWYQDGVKKGKMERKDGLDPLAVEMYDGDKPKKHKWVNAMLTSHLYYAKAEKGKKITVEFKDKFGNIYTEELKA